jgi:hypothetical protein
LASILFVAAKTRWGDRLRGFSDANCTKHETGSLADDLADRGIININIHYRENPHPSRLVGDYGSGDAAGLGMPTVTGSRLGVDVTIMTFDASQVTLMLCVAR